MFCVASMPACTVRRLQHVGEYKEVADWQLLISAAEQTRWPGRGWRPGSLAQTQLGQ